MNDGKQMYNAMYSLQPVDHDGAVFHISFYEASAFAFWKTIRLPTEVEWEVASDHFEWRSRWDCKNFPYLSYHVLKKEAGEYNLKFKVNKMVLLGFTETTSERHSRNKQPKVLPDQSEPAVYRGTTYLTV